MSMVAALWLAPAVARAEQAEERIIIRATFVLNFIRFSKWPDQSFKDAQSPLIVTIIGEPRLATHLARLIGDQKVNDRPVKVVTAAPPAGPAQGEQHQAFIAELRASHVVYLDARLEEPQRAAVVAAVNGSDVLTIGNGPGFAERGGMLGLVLRRDKYYIEANMDAITRARVSVSSKVLRLAKIVRPAD